MVNSLTLALSKSEQQEPRPEEAIDGTIYDRARSTGTTYEPVVDGLYLGMIVSTTLSKNDVFAPSSKDLYRERRTEGEVVDPLPLLRIERAEGKERLVVLPEGVRYMARGWYMEDLSESDLAQYRGFSTMFAQGSKLAVTFVDETGSGTQTQAVAFVDVAQFMEYLRNDDALLRTVISMHKMTDQQLCDFAASFPQNVVHIPSLQSKGAKTIRVREIAAEPPPSTEELQENFFFRLGNTATNVYPWLHRDIPEEFKRMMPLGAGPKLEQDPFRFGQPIDTIVKQAAGVGITHQLGSTTSGRTLTIDLVTVWHRQYQLEEISGKGLITATEIAWFEEEPLFRLEGQRERLTQMLSRQSIEFKVEVDDPRELKIAYWDRYEGRMVFHQKITKKDGEPGKPWALITTKTLVLPGK
jgi:hypothetical protein